jgi:hypothetical protein
MTRMTRLVLAFGTFALISCGSVKPDDKLQKVITGDIFQGSPSNPADEKKREEQARESERVMPHKEEQKGVGLKMEF